MHFSIQEWFSTETRWAFEPLIVSGQQWVKTQVKCLSKVFLINFRVSCREKKELMESKNGKTFNLTIHSWSSRLDEGQDVTLGKVKEV